MNSPDILDYVVIGGGSAGCAVAAGLARSGKHSVMLLEAGEARRSIWIRVPAGVAYLIRDERVVRKFYTQPEARLKDRPIYWPRGRLLGGSSAVNGMIWVHGDAKEYDRWRDEHGLAGWDGESFKAYLRRVESFQAGDPAVRGRQGPVAISEYGPRQPLMDAFVAACVQAGIPRNADYNGKDYEGVGYLQMNTRRGLRVSARDAYLASLPRGSALRVETGAMAERILFEGNRACGVEYRKNGVRRRILAAKEVILSAGALQSPQLLELSGIGDSERLSGLGIPVQHHAPSVGEGLRDHLHVRLTYECRNARTLNQIVPSPWRKALMALRLAASGDGLMSSASAVAHALVRTDPGQQQPDAKLQLHYLSSEDARTAGKLVLDDFPGFSIGTFALRPKSQGSVHIASKDPEAGPVIHGNYLQHPDDVRSTLGALRLARQVAGQPALSGFVVRETRPGPACTSDETLLDYVGSLGQTSYHPIGSCRMGSDAGSVVDARLRVRGVSCLRVADASVMPTMPSANTNAPSIAIGEKAADLILEDARNA
ncbi:GMC family oxidoreductase [Achromobacter anxifer]|jgi:choline dehydrogenase|uniref:Oxygen-dependent choline dehydrogenase n=1 Tax=Achromobacter anxifer TaxID=1287737 RepID=A0A6S7E3W9_9BURK|nr:GMC family oxidoreductase N-terminal domain-containing protein [Achromobacter anxifer]MDF8365150.1 GMC family oxidoreductase N-terminal domain-containing protein [Achromobacter anxifer]CAB3895312.1 Oxygen-dependent choline dehydrogenase [Achromobacter anxifer]CAB5511611.1 Oxygen-dependent choline dehydrogenase [Achromobacter anxifer]